MADKAALPVRRNKGRERNKKVNPIAPTTSKFGPPKTTKDRAIPKPSRLVKKKVHPSVSGNCSKFVDVPIKVSDSNVDDSSKEGTTPETEAMQKKLDGVYHHCLDVMDLSMAEGRSQTLNGPLLDNLWSTTSESESSFSIASTSPHSLKDNSTTDQTETCPHMKGTLQDGANHKLKCCRCCKITKGKLGSKDCTKFDIKSSSTDGPKCDMKLSSTDDAKCDIKLSSTDGAKFDINFSSTDDASFDINVGQQDDNSISFSWSDSESNSSYTCEMDMYRKNKPRNCTVNTPQKSMNLADIAKQQDILAVNDTSMDKPSSKDNAKFDTKPSSTDGASFDIKDGQEDDNSISWSESESNSSFTCEMYKNRKNKPCTVSTPQKSISLSDIAKKLDAFLFNDTSSGVSLNDHPIETPPQTCTDDYKLDKSSADSTDKECDDDVPSDSALEKLTKSPFTHEPKYSHRGSNEPVNDLEESTSYTALQVKVKEDETSDSIQEDPIKCPTFTHEPKFIHRDTNVLVNDHQESTSYTAPQVKVEDDETSDSMLENPLKYPSFTQEPKYSYRGSNEQVGVLEESTSSTATESKQRKKVLIKKATKALRSIRSGSSLNLDKWLPTEKVPESGKDEKNVMDEKRPPEVIGEVLDYGDSDTDTYHTLSSAGTPSDSMLQLAIKALHSPSLTDYDSTPLSFFNSSDEDLNEELWDNEEFGSGNTPNDERPENLLQNFNILRRKSSELVRSKTFKTTPYCQTTLENFECVQAEEFADEKGSSVMSDTISKCPDFKNNNLIKEPKETYSSDGTPDVVKSQTSGKFTNDNTTATIACSGSSEPSNAVKCNKSLEMSNIRSNEFKTHISMSQLAMALSNKDENIDSADSDENNDSDDSTDSDETYLNCAEIDRLLSKIHPFKKSEDETDAEVVRREVPRMQSPPLYLETEAIGQGNLEMVLDEKDFKEVSLLSDNEQTKTSSCETATIKSNELQIYKKISTVSSALSSQMSLERCSSSAQRQKGKRKLRGRIRTYLKYLWCINTQSEER